MERKIIFLDVDGTLADRPGHIPDSAVRAVRQARRNGTLCVVNTGRPYTHLDPELTAIGFDAYICSCGQTIVRDGVYLYHLECGHDLCETILDRAEECGVDLFLEGEKGLWHFFRRPMRAGVRREFERFRARGFDVDADVRSPEVVFDKFCVWAYPDSRTERFLSSMAEWFHATDRGNGMFEMVRSGCSKAEGIRRVLELFGLDRENSYAAGDSTNDIPMLTAVAHPIVMGNCDPGLESYAEYVTGKASENGLEQAFVRFGLLGCG